jgi:Zn-dependent protease
MLSNLSPIDIVIVIISLVVSLGVHEAMHAFVAHRLGDDTAYREGRLTLNPLKHIDFLTTIVLPTALLIMGLPPILVAKPVPIDPSQVRHEEYGSALVALAGPFTNLGLAIVGAALTHLVGGQGLLGSIFGIFTVLNVGIFIFNMLPIPPLDGSRLLYAFAPEPLQRVMYQIESMGFIVLIVILLALSSVISPILAYLNQFVLGFLF